MTTQLRNAIANQLQATLQTMDACIDQCPESWWSERVVNLTFSQCVFHTLFFTDYYLQSDPDQFREQPFHREHPEFFKDYEELEDRPQTHHYQRPAVKQYLAFVKELADRRLGAETDESLGQPCPFHRLGFSRGELYVYITRHVQHHSGQLGAFLRKHCDISIPWFKSGWPSSPS